MLEATGVSLGDFASLADQDAGPPTVPLIGLAQAGEDGFFDDAGLPIGEGWEQTELPAPRAGLFSLRIAGDSMAPLYRDGDQVVVDTAAADIRKGDRVVVRTTGGETLAKELAAMDARRLVLTSINPAYADRTVPRGEVAWLGLITWARQ